MADVLMTGLPRSGTTLVASLLNRQPNTVALAEPFALSRDLDRQGAVAEIIALMRTCRAQALAGSPLPTKHVGGEIPENWVEPPRVDARLRRVLEQRGALSFNTDLSDDFTLVVKHPAEFTALADLLTDHFPLFAVVRDPLAVLAAWQTVDMPVHRGRMPMLECFAPDDLAGRLDRIEDPLDRQVHLLEFQLKTYLSLGHDRIIRYEDVVTHPRAALAKLCSVEIDLPQRSAYDPVERYRGVDFPELAARLRPILPLIEAFYPEFQRQWRAFLPAATMVSVPPSAPSTQPSAAPATHASDAPRVFVMGAYVPAGGTRMTYEIGRVAKARLGLSCYAVTLGDEDAQQSVFDYADMFDCVPRDDLPSLVRPQDILICTPSLSDGWVGLTHNCRKMMYVQGFNTFSTLDRWFDRHVAVGGFVQDFLANVYALEAPIIRPFIATDGVSPTSWWTREPKSVWFYLKGNYKTQIALLDRLRTEVRHIDPVAEAAIDWEGSVLFAGSHKQRDLLARLAERRHFVTLSVCEGFGLVPLEAMAIGMTVIGFDGFGGRDYMRPAYNCFVQAYPNLRGVALNLLECLQNPERAASVAAKGPGTAAEYSRNQFEEGWRVQLESLLEQRS